ncbi:hypothetical protein [Paraburkholderia phenoliruptrix]|uniref:hypothetical protein n=1 Tax=Paraburkholderia phenoliruptrix TaxID=252970 RepID=UPI0034CD6616
MTTEHPMLFTGEMVRAILGGSKTQTRRIVKKQPPDGWDRNCWYSAPVWGWTAQQTPASQWHTVRCPFGEPGDRLWVRETWQHSNHPFGPYDDDCDVFYRADYLDDPLGPDLERSADGIRRQWRPSIHMPRRACRLTLENTGVRVERLQDISEADCIAEGIQRYTGPLRWVRYLDAVTGEPAHNTARDAYFSLWEHLHGRGSVEVNPWLWVIDFRRDGA